MGNEKVSSAGALVDGRRRLGGARGAGGYDVALGVELDGDELRGHADLEVGEGTDPTTKGDVHREPVGHVHVGEHVEATQIQGQGVLEIGHRHVLEAHAESEPLLVLPRRRQMRVDDHDLRAEVAVAGRCVPRIREALVTDGGRALHADPEGPVLQTEVGRQAEGRAEGEETLLLRLPLEGDGRVGEVVVVQHPRATQERKLARVPVDGRGVVGLRHEGPAAPDGVQALGAVLEATGEKPALP